MKYRSITLNGNKGVPYALVKYTKEYKRYLEKLRELNPELADSVEQGPKIYSEQSEHQSYMIFSGRRDCVGAIYIGTSTDEKNLEIKLHFKEKYFKTNYDIVAVIEQLVDSLTKKIEDIKEKFEKEIIKWKNLFKKLCSAIDKVLNKEPEVNLEDYEVVADNINDINDLSTQAKNLCEKILKFIENSNTN